MLRSQGEVQLSLRRGESFEPCGPCTCTTAFTSKHGSRRPSIVTLATDGAPSESSLLFGTEADKVKMNLELTSDENACIPREEKGETRPGQSLMNGFKMGTRTRSSPGRGRQGFVNVGTPGAASSRPNPTTGLGEIRSYLEDEWNSPLPCLFLGEAREGMNRG